MKRAWLDWVLMAVCAIGCIAFVRVQSQLSKLRQEDARIVAAVGEMPIIDPNVIQVKTLDTGKPWHWAWRIYEPDGVQGNISYTIGNTGSGGKHSFSSHQQQYIASVRLTPQSDGTLALYTRFLNSSGLSSFGSAELAKFLTEHRDELIVEQLGADEPQQVKSGAAPVTLLRISLPEPLAGQAREKFSTSGEGQYLPTVLEMSIEVP